MVEIGQTLSSLPQLASAVILGAGKSTDVARRILLGEFNSSGRYYVDVEEIVRDGAGEALAKVGPLEAECSLEVISPAQVEPLVFSPEALTEAEIRSIVGYGILAPSAGNCQPWKFVFRDGRLLCLHDVERSMSFLDFQYCATYLAFGAVVENVSLAAAGLGREAEVQLFPNPQDTRLVSEVRFSRSVSPHDQPELLDQIPWRVTNRKLGKRVPLNEQTLATLMRTAAEHGAELQLLTGDDELDEVGTILGAVDRFQFLSRIPHQEMMAELRWMPQEVEATRDGIDVATLEFSAADKAAIRIISSWPAMKMLGKIGGGKALEKPAKKAVAAASAVGLLSVKGTGPGSYFMGGRAMQQVWLTATAQGLVFHPMSGICYLFARLERGEGFSEKEARTLTRLRERYLGLFRLLGERAEVLLFRVARAAQPTARSLRRKLEDVLLFK
jgi:nitroreductase